jgi:hypothetical protein
MRRGCVITRDLSALRIAFAALVGVQILHTTATAAGAADWLTYQNDRYGTTIDYPGAFQPQPPPDDDDGRQFKSADGADFSVFASYNALNFDLAAFQAFTIKNLPSGQVVTYQAHGANWFVISGSSGGSIFYDKYLLSHGGQMTEGFVMSYPAQLKQTYAPIVTRMAQSFRSGSGFQTPAAKP